MTRRTRTSREAENRLAALESVGEGNVVGWFDWMDYSIECAETENPPTPEEVFGEGWTYPDAGRVENLRAAGYDLSNETAGSGSRDSVSLAAYHETNDGEGV